MSLSKVSSLCVFCNTEKVIYKCPKCDVKYCSARCFKHQKHSACSELFYKEWVLSSLRENETSESDKGKMIKILKKNYADRNDVSDVQAAVEGRFSNIDLSSDIDEEIIWQKLTLEEQEMFSNMLSQEEIADIIPMIKPWWVAGRVKFVESSSKVPSDKHLIAKRPPLPVGIKTLNELTSVPPSHSVQYSIINILYSYTCLIKLYHNDLRDFVEDAVDMFFSFCPVFTGKNYFSLNETVQDSLRLITNSQFKLDMTFAKSLSHDVCCIINGPVNAPSHLFVICALNDIKLLMLSFKTLCLKSDTWKFSKHSLLRTIKKLDYFISWSVDCYERNLKCLSKEVELKYVSEIADDICSRHSVTKFESHAKILEDFN